MYTNVVVNSVCKMHTIPVWYRIMCSAFCKTLFRCMRYFVFCCVLLCFSS
jgi:hypothetical protein